MLVSGRSRRVLSCLALSVATVRCTPDFDSLSGRDGTGGLGAGGSGGGLVAIGASAGVAGSGGTSSAGVGLGGSEPKPIAGAGAVQTGGTAGEGTGGTAGSPATDGGEGGAAGAGPTPCVWAPAVSTHYDGFDAGLDGQGFDSVITTAAANSTLGATASSAWDDAVGKTCPGSLLLAVAFKGYVSEQKQELAVADLRFNADWSGATKVHAWVRVSPSNAPITGVQFFVMSGSSYLYASVFDNHKFALGEWYEVVLPLAPGNDYDPTHVHRVGVQVTLRQEDVAGNPPVAPTVQTWLDDIWVE
jgi:hypothetical protein